MSQQPSSAGSPATENLDDMPFSLEDSFFDKLGTSDGGLYVYRDIPPDTAELFFAKRDGRRQHLRLHYHPWEQVLMVAVPSHQLEIGQSVLSSLITQQLQSMVGAGVDGWALCGPATFGERFNTTGKGEGDDSGLPVCDRYRAWPTLVVEAAWSQHTAEAHEKMQWWFTASANAVKIVLVMLLDKEGERLVVEKYTGGQQDIDLEENTLEIEPVLQQTITMTPQRRDEPQNRLPIPGDVAVIYTRPTTDDDGEQAEAQPAFSTPRPATRATARQLPPSTQDSADCAGGPLRLEFSLLFLRPPVEDLGERDVIVEASDLARMAGMVFDSGRVSDAQAARRRLYARYAVEDEPPEMDDIAQIQQRIEQIRQWVDALCRAGAYD